MIELPDNDPRLIALKSKNPKLVPMIEFSGAHVGKYVAWSEPISVGGSTYQPIPIVALGLIETSSPPGRNIHEIGIADPENEWSDRLNVSSSGLRVKMGALLLTDDGWTQPLYHFTGKVVQPLRSTTESGKVLGLKCASLLSQVDSTHAIHITDADQRKRNANDNSLAGLANARDSLVNPLPK